MKQLILITIFVSALLCGCGTPQKTAYKTLGSIAITVDAAKKAFYDYRATHGVSADVEARAKATYLTYQKAMAIAEVAEKQWLANGDKSVWENAYAAVLSSGSQFLDLARQFIPTLKTL